MATGMSIYSNLSPEMPRNSDGELPWDHPDIGPDKTRKSTCWSFTKVLQVSCPYIGVADLRSFNAKVEDKADLVAQTHCQ